jgi:diguanylate cyclase (GGDEF)-like protein
MKYNILIFDAISNKETILTLLDHIENVKTFFVDDIDSFEYILNSDKIFTIIINEDLICIDQAYSLLQLSILNAEDIPILITSKQSTTKITNDAIFDYLDLENKHLSINKLKICKKEFLNENRFEQDIQTLLYTDNLTGIPNREQLIKDMQDEILHISAISLIDISGFKEINDFYGFRTADKLLQMITEFIEELLEDNEDILLYKFPQDIFCLAYGGEDPRIFEIVSIDIIKKIDAKLLYIDGYDIDVKVVTGISFSQKTNKLATADIALNLAKRKNKDYLIFTEDLDRHTEYKNNMKWLRKVREALKHDNIIVYFQPLICNRTFEVKKYECLVRMIDGDKIISPYFFLDIAKKSHQYPDITKIVIEKSIETFKDLPFEFSLNISFDDIEDEEFLPYIHNIVTKYNVAHKIVWELLEDSSIKDYDILYNFISEVKKMGSKVAIDDFGTGYSNFSHILKMDIDYLKIDASLIKNIVTDKTSFKIVKTIIQFAKNLELETIAEYVENEGIFELIVGLGADFSQGYYFSPPIDYPSKIDYKEKRTSKTIFNCLSHEFFK